MGGHHLNLSNLIDCQFGHLHYLEIWPPGGATCIRRNFFQRMAFNKVFIRSSTRSSTKSSPGFNKVLIGSSPGLYKVYYNKVSYTYNHT